MLDINQKLPGESGRILMQPIMANSSDEVPAKKLKLSPITREDIQTLSHEELVEMVLLQQQEIEGLKAKTVIDPGLDGLMLTVEKLKQQVTDSAQQENKLVLRLSGKEHEVQELMTRIQEIKQSHHPSSSQLAAMLLDPAINLMFYHMKQEMDLLKGKLEQAQNDLAAWKFTPDSQTGKRLMAKCRMLLQENEELGKNVSTGRVAKLQADIALQKTLITEMKKSEAATEDFMAEVDDDMEVMQSTVYLMQQELKDARERLLKYESSAAASVPSVSAQTNQNSSVAEKVHSEEVRTENELACKIERHDNGIAEISSSNVTCWDTAIDDKADGICKTKLSGQQISSKIETACVAFDCNGEPEGDCGDNGEFTVSSNVLVRNHNSDLRTSPVEFATLVENQPSSDSYSSDAGLKPDIANIDCDSDLHCHKLRTAEWNSESVSDPKVNGVNILVPSLTDEND